MAQLEALDGKFEEDLIRHMVLMFFRSYKRAYPGQEMVLCCDGANSWRKDFFPNYKMSRKPKEVSEDEKDPDALDLAELWRILSLIRDEMKTRMPYRVIHLPKVEGDDAIAILAKHYPGPHVIVSNDKDFGQLQKYPGVIQYSPLKKNHGLKAEIIIDDPERFLKEQIIRGDRIDDVPNILSDDDVFLDKSKRQKSIMTKKLDAYLSESLENNFEKAKIERNRKMIDFDEIPQEYVDKVIVEFESQSGKRVTKQDIFQYFMSKRLSRLMDLIQDF